MATFWRGFGDADGISDWTQVELTSGHTDPAWSVVNTDQLQATSASSHNEALVWDDIDADGDRDDFEILCQVYADSTSTTQRFLVGRVSTSGGSRTGYAVRVRTNSIDTYRFNGSSYTAISNGTFSVASGTWVWVRFRVNGSVVRARAWADGDSEPGTWQCAATDSTYTTLGHVGVIKGANTSTQLWRKFGVGTNGDTAPDSAGGSSVALAGTPAAVATAAAALDLIIPLAAAAAGQATAAGALALGVPLAGAAVATAVGSGTLAGGSSVNLDGAAVGQASATGALSLSIALTGAAVGQATGAAGLTHGVPLAGAAVAQATGTGQIALSIALAGAALSQASASASFVGSVALSGSAAAQAGVSGALTLSVPLAGQAQALAAAAGGLVITVLLNGAAMASATASGALNVPVMLSGTAVGQAFATGQLAGTTTWRQVLRRSVRVSAELQRAVGVTTALLRAVRTNTEEQA